MAKSNGGRVAGFRYNLGVFMGVCTGPVDALIAIRVGDILAWAGNATTNIDFAVNQPNLFGGDTKEGGIVGNVQVFMGGPTQVLPDNVKNSLNGLGVSQVPNTATELDVATVVDGVVVDPVIVPPGSGPVPGFRNAFTMFFRGQVCTNSPYPKPWKMRVRRSIAGWDGGCWYPETATVLLDSEQGVLGPDIYAMNGAHIIYECA